MNGKYFIDIVALRTEMAFQEYSKSTQTVYVRTVKSFLEYTDKETIKITRADVIRYLDFKLKTMKKNSVLVELNALEFFFEEVLGLNITYNIKKYRREYKVKEFITLQEYDILMNSVSTRERIMYLLYKETNLKIEKILSLKECDLEGLNLKHEVKKEVYEYIERNYLNKIFFIDPAAARWWNRKNTEEILGKSYTFSDLKHSLAIELYLKKGDENGAMEFLGYKSRAALRQFYKRAGFDYEVIMEK